MAKTLRFLVALTVSVTGSLHAQDAPPERAGLPVQFEIRGEMARALGDLEDLVGGEPGLGLGVAARVWVFDGAAVYLGWDWYRFADVVDSARVEFTDPGFRLGAQYQARMGRVEPFVYAGAFNSRPELERRRGEEREEIDYERSWGGEVGGGVVVPVWSRVSLVPEARYRFHELDSIDPAASVSSFNARYVGLNVGVVWSLRPRRPIFH